MNSEISEETEENLERGVFKLLPNQRRWLDEDGDVTYGKAADHKVKMPGLGAKQLPFGLDVTRMSQWWNVFRHNPKSTYTLCSRHLNCSGVVVTALKAGGAESFVKAPTARLFLDPNQVRRWAEAVRDEINRLNENAKRMALVLNETKLSTPSKGAPWGNNDLMSYDDWMRYSKINSFMSVRSPEVLKMDRYVREYHGLNWETAADQKVQMLGKLMETIAQYLSQKSNSKRSQAVLDLGNQVMAVAIMLPMFRKLPPVAWAQN